MYENVGASTSRHHKGLHGLDRDKKKHNLYIKVVTPEQEI
jgi:hypothetical protein